MLVEKLPVFIQSGDLEVQERACCILQVGQSCTIIWNYCMGIVVILITYYNDLHM